MTPQSPSLHATADSWALLSSAICEGRDDELRALLSSGADPNARSGIKVESRLLIAPPTLLYLACSKGSAGSVRALLAAGADPRALSPGLTPEGKRSTLSAAHAIVDSVYIPNPPPGAMEQGAEKMRALIDAGLRPDTPCHLGRSLWQELLLWDGAPLPLIQPWLDAGADIDGWGEQGRSFLFNAIFQCDMPSALGLLELGADPFKPCRDGSTPAQACRTLDAPRRELAARFDAMAEREAMERSVPSAQRARSGPAL